MTVAEFVPLPLTKKDTYRDELNFAEFPIASLSDSIPKDQKTLVFTDQILDRGRNEKVNRKLTITASDEYGLPTAMDDEVLLGLIQLTNVGSFSDRKVHFTRYELIRLLDWRLETKSYDRIEQSLKRWLGVTLYYEKAWWSKEEQCWVDESFHVLDQVTIFDRERRDRRVKADGDNPTAGRSSFLWNEVVFNSFKAGYLKQLDFDQVKQLESAISKRMYRFLDKRFYHRSRLEFDLRNFACEHIGLSKNYHNGELKRRLNPAILELEKVGYLTALPKDKRFVKKGHGEWTIVLHQAAKGRGVIPEVVLEGNDSELVNELVTRGITRSVAKALLAGSSPDFVKNKLEIFDWLKNKSDKRLSQNPAGYLVKSIQENYAPPSDFVGADDQAKKSELSKKRAQESQAKLEAATRLQAQKEAEERQPLDEFWNSLTVDQQSKFEEEAVKSTDKFFADQYWRGKREGEGTLFRTTRQAIIDQHIRRTLTRQSSEAA